MIQTDTAEYAGHAAFWWAMGAATMYLSLAARVARLQRAVLTLGTRCLEQSELLSRRAERPAAG